MVKDKGKPENKYTAIGIIPPEEETGTENILLTRFFRWDKSKYDY